MTPNDTEQVAVAMAAILDAALSAIDPSGLSLRRACSILRDGLHLAKEMGTPDSVAAEIVGQFVQNIEESYSL